MHANISLNALDPLSALGAKVVKLAPAAPEPAKPVSDWACATRGDAAGADTPEAMAKLMGQVWRDFEDAPLDEATERAGFFASLALQESKGARPEAGYFAHVYDEAFYRALLGSGDDADSRPAEPPPELYTGELGTIDDAIKIVPANFIVGADFGAGDEATVSVFVPLLPAPDAVAQPYPWPIKRHESSPEVARIWSNMLKDAAAKDNPLAKLVKTVGDADG